MSDKDNGGPAFAHGNPTHGGDPGMTLRQWYAGQALKGILSFNGDYGSTEKPYLADACFQWADAMIAEGKKP